MTVRQRAWILPPATLFLMAGILLGREMSSPLPAWLACLPAVAAVFLLRGRFRFAACLMLFLAFGAAAGQAAWHPVLPLEGEYEIRGIVSDEIRRGSYGQVRTCLSEVTLNGRALSSGAYWTFYTDDDSLPEGLEPGREVSFRASLYHPGGAENPDGYNFREELLRRGVTVGVYGKDGLAVSSPSVFSFAGVAAAWRGRLSAALIREMGEEAGGYTSALLLGNRSLVPSEDRAAFSRLGIAHILSVSGFHTAVLVMLLAALFRILKLRQSLRMILYGAVLLAYCALCGMNPPVVRASLLLMLNLGGKMLNRPRIGLHLLCAAAVFMLLLSPVQLTGVSFQLTFSAMLGLTLVTPYPDSLNPFHRKIPRRLWSSAAVVFGVQLGVLLPELYHFQKLPLLALLVNLPVSVFSAVLLTVDWLILLLLPVPFLSRLPAMAGTWLTSLMVGGVRELSSLPGITLWTRASTWLTALGIIILFFSLCLLFPLRCRTRFLCLVSGLLVVFVSLIPLPHNGTEYIQFSAGNADAAVLWDRDRVLVMDAGLDDGIVSGFLRRNRLTPDAVILTHLHSDHAAGLKSLLDDEIPVPVLYLPSGAEDQQIDAGILALLDRMRASGTEFRELSRGDSLPLPSGSLTVLWPEKGRTRPGQDANNYSLVSFFALQGVAFLQTGDITETYESYSAVQADLLKAAHHGSRFSTSPDFLSAVDPRAVLLSCEKLSRANEFSERAGGIPVWSTAESGALTVRFSDGAFTVVPFLSESDSGGV